MIHPCFYQPGGLKIGYDKVFIHYDYFANLLLLSFNNYLVRMYIGKIKIFTYLFHLFS